MKRDIFKDASVRLASLYLIIIMAISLLFSFWLYNVSISEIRQSVLRVPGPIQRILLDDNPNFARELRDSQEQAVEDARDNLIYQLAVLNIFIAITGASISYFIARHTLRPIEEAHEAQSKFTADASHELRTPITAMKVETELTLTEPKLTLAIAKKQLESNLEELDKLTALSENLLQLARLDSGKTSKEQVALSTIIKNAVATIRPLSESKNQPIKLNKIPSLKIHAHAPSLTEALVTILDNAVKYSPEKSPITINIKQSQRHVILTIEDRGIGIAPDTIDHIFDRFYRADESRNKDTATGFGIGLAIAKSTITAHGGTITATSTLTKGSTFTISLPIA